LALGGLAGDPLFSNRSVRERPAQKLWKQPARRRSGLGWPVLGPVAPQV